MPTETQAPTRTRISAHTDPETGKTVVETKEISPSIQAQIADVEMSAAQKRLRQLKQQSAPIVEAVEIDGETWFFKRLNWAELTKLALLTSRDGSGQITPTDSHDLQGLAAATLHCCIRADKTGMDDYFSLAEAHEWVLEPSAMRLVEKLFNKSIALNPEILPRADGDEKKE